MMTRAKPLKLSACLRQAEGENITFGKLVPSATFFSILLALLVLFSLVACDAIGGKTPEQTEAETTKADYHPADPDSIAVSEDEQAKGYRIYQGIYYFEGGGKYLYELTTDRIYVLPQLIGALMPADFYDGFKTGDTIRLKAVEREYARVAELQGKQIALVYEGTAANIPEEALNRLVEKDAPYFED